MVCDPVLWLRMAQRALGIIQPCERPDACILRHTLQVVEADVAVAPFLVNGFAFTRDRVFGLAVGIRE